MKFLKSLISKIRRASIRVRSALDVYSEKITPKSKVKQAFFIPSFPFVVMLAVFAACAAVGVESSRECPPSTLLHLAVPAFREHPSECRELPLVADLPSVALGVTSTLAVTLYLTLVRRLSRLQRDLVASGLVRPEKFKEGKLAEKLGRLNGEIRLGRLVKVVLLAVSAIGSGYLYWAAYKGGRAFSDLSEISRDHPSEDVLRASWWANYTEHPLLAATWIAVGTIGVYFAAKQAYIYQKILMFSIRSRKHWSFQYVPRDRDDDFGWKPVGDVNAMVYLGFLNFTVSLFAVAYILQGAPGKSGNTVIGVMALVGIWANLGIVLALLWVMVKNHRKIIIRKRAEVKRRLLERGDGTVASRGPSTGERDFSYLSVQGKLLYEAPRWYPLRGRLRPLLSVAPGLFAFYKAGAELIKLIQ